MMMMHLKALMPVVIACCWCVGPSQQAQTGFFIGNTGNYDGTSGTTGGNVLPTLVFSGKTSGAFDVYANSDFYNSIPPSFQYRIVPSSRAVDASHAFWVPDKDILAVVSPRTNCVDLLKATSITVRTGNPVVTKEVPLIPVPTSQVWVPENKDTAPVTITSDEPGIARESLSACCNPADCLDKCLEFTASQVWYLEINAPQWGYDGGRGTASGSMRDFGFRDPGVWPVFRAQCTYCPTISCITECSNGEFSTGYTTIDSATGFQINNVKCKPCEPGTWNTCQYGETCKWSIPKNEKDKTVGKDTIQPFAGGPVYACYNCSRVNSCLTCPVHYQGGSRDTFIDTTTSWMCPGGPDPPRNCLSKNFAMSVDGKDCVCIPGTYPVGLDCVLCPKGHMCPNGLLVQCPMHYHQPAEGATSCVKCGTTGDRNGFYKCTQRGKLLQFCDPTVAGTQTKDPVQNCIPCNQCSRFYTGDAGSDLHECYRDN